MRAGGHYHYSLSDLDSNLTTTTYNFILEYAHKNPKLLLRMLENNIVGNGRLVTVGDSAQNQ